MKNRTATINRITNETDIEMSLCLDGSGVYKGSSGIGFLDHMLELFTKQSRFDVTLKVSGDLQVDEHHTVEDIGIVLGQAFVQATGNKRGINRYGFFILPMDESLATVVVDMAGRSYFRFECDFQREIVGDLPTELVYDFWNAIVQNARINLQIKVEKGRNDHHKIESIFKCTGRALRIAIAKDTQNIYEIPSTKGEL